MNKNTNIIGLSGVARSGKDTFALILSNQLKNRGYRVKTLAIAAPLKDMCADFCKEHLNIDVWSNDDKEKDIIRPFLVWFGDAKRKMSNGRFWIDLANKEINKIKSSGEYDYIIITDVRYQVYEQDEVYWLFKQLNASLVHITQMLILKDGKKTELLPPNEHEAKNNPYIQQMSNYKIVWDKVKSDDLLNEPSLNEHVEKFVEWYFEKN